MRGLTSKVVLEKTMLVNETRWRIVYSAPGEISMGRVSDTIAAETGEALHYLKLSREGSTVVVGPEAEVAAWIKYYYYEPHSVPNKDINLKIEKAFLKVCGVCVSLDVMRSYSPEVIDHLQKFLRAKYCSGSTERKVLESLLKTIKKSN